MGNTEWKVIQVGGNGGMEAWRDETPVVLETVGIRDRHIRLRTWEENTMKDSRKFTSNCYLVATICYFISGAISILNNEQIPLGIGLIGLSIAFLCLTILYRRKPKSKDNKEDKA